MGVSESTGCAVAISPPLEDRQWWCVSVHCWPGAECWRIMFVGLGDSAAAGRRGYARITPGTASFL